MWVQTTTRSPRSDDVECYLLHMFLLLYFQFYFQFPSSTWTYELQLSLRTIFSMVVILYAFAGQNYVPLDFEQCQSLVLSRLLHIFCLFKPFNAKCWSISRNRLYLRIWVWGTVIIQMSVVFCHRTILYFVKTCNRKFGKF